MEHPTCITCNEKLTFNEKTKCYGDICEKCKKKKCDNCKKNYIGKYCMKCYYNTKEVIYYKNHSSISCYCSDYIEDICKSCNITTPYDLVFKPCYCCNKKFRKKCIRCKKLNKNKEI